MNFNNFNNIDYYEMDKLNETYFKDDYNRMKKREIPMLVDLNYYTYGGIQSNIVYYHCPNCYNKIKRKSNYCSTCGQHLLWIDTGINVDGGTFI